MNFVFAGDIPLMVSEHLFKKREFIDRRNKEFFIEQNTFKNKSIIVKKMSNVENSIRKNTEKKQYKKLRIYLK